MEPANEPIGAQRKLGVHPFPMKTLYSILLLGFLASCSSSHVPRGASLTPESARSLALMLANRESYDQFGSQPFGASTVPALSNGRWHWSERSACGRGDLEADISFDADGGAPVVRLVVLSSMPLIEM